MSWFRKNENIHNDSCIGIGTGYGDVFSVPESLFMAKLLDIHKQSGKQLTCLKRTGYPVDDKAFELEVLKFFESERAVVIGQLKQELSDNSFQNHVIAESPRAFYKLIKSSDSHARVLIVITMDEGVVDALREFAATQLLSRPRSSGKVYLLIRDEDGFSTRSIGYGAIPLERGNYSDKVLADFDKISSSLNAAAPFGRLVILDGPHGTGKTYFVRGLLDSVPEALFLYVPAAMVVDLQGPSLVPALLNLADNRNERNRGHYPIVLVVEDADSSLVKRDDGNVSQVSAMLNLSDGLYGELLDLRVICTTNRKLGDLDPAIVRPGRLLVHSHIGSLTREQGMVILKRLIGDKSELPASLRAPLLSEVYAVALDNGWEPPAPKRGIGFGADQYFLPEDYD
jgi:hypothetical protein